MINFFWTYYLYIYYEGSYDGKSGYGDASSAFFNTFFFVQIPFLMFLFACFDVPKWDVARIVLFDNAKGGVKVWYVIIFLLGLVLQYFAIPKMTFSEMEIKVRTNSFFKKRNPLIIVIPIIISLIGIILKSLYFR